MSDLVLKRDIYYTQYPGYADYDQSGTGRSARQSRRTVRPARRPRAVRRPRAHRATTDYPIGRDRYMMMGDNSPRSKDSRGWDPPKTSPGMSPSRESWEVPRALLTGKAFFVYWPHGKPFGPDIRVSDPTSGSRSDPTSNG